MHSHFHGACRYEWRRYLHAPDWGSKSKICSQIVQIRCVLNHERISWVSIEIYYHDNFVFGHIFMFLTSRFANFCILCTYLVGKQQEAYGESNGGMSFICWHMLWSGTPPYAGLRTSFGLAHEGLQELVSRLWADLGSAWRPYPKGFRG